MDSPEEQLRKLAADVVDWHGETMKRWDLIRHQVMTYEGSDLPRMNFEGLMDDFSEVMIAGADELRRTYETINQTEDLLGCALAHLQGDPGYGSKAAIIGYLQAYFDARKAQRGLGQQLKGSE